MIPLYGGSEVLPSTSDKTKLFSEIQARFPLGDKWRYLVTMYMSDSEGKEILFLKLVVLFKMKKKKRRKRKKLSTRIIS